jgi:hypothetical protein
MLQYAQWHLAEEKGKTVLTHLTHIEDLILTKFGAGVQETLTSIKNTAKLFTGEKANVKGSVKIDGSPSLVCGIDPKDSKFFIGTKGVFSKTPKLAKSHSDINNLYSGKQGLIDLMHTAFTELSKLSWPEIMQGDVLFTTSTKKITTVDGIKYVTFKPNTIVYAVPVASSLGNKVIAAKFGITFHTNYGKPKSIETMTAKPGADISRITPPASLLIISNEFSVGPEGPTLTPKELAVLEGQISYLSKQASTIRGNDFLRVLQINPILRDYFMQFQNSLVRQGQSITSSPRSVANNFIVYLQSIQAKLASERNSVLGKTNIAEKFQGLVGLVAATRSSIIEILEWQNTVISIKTLLLRNISLPQLHAYYDEGAGLIAGSHEGFVASDKVGNMVKFVDRLEFSRRNFIQNN